MVKKVGFEAEFFVRDIVSNQLVFPSKYGIPTDEYILTAERRGKESSIPEEAAANLVQKLFATRTRARENKLFLDLTGYVEISPKLNAEVLRRMSTKAVPATANIFGQDILQYFDGTVDKDGLIKSIRKSAGFHINFSVKTGLSFTHKQPKYIKLPHKEEYINTGETDIIEKSAEVSLLTLPAIKHIIERLDEVLYDRYSLEDSTNLRHRKRGTYRVKYDVVEYRSLPFTELVLAEIDVISEKVFQILGEL